MPKAITKAKETDIPEVIEFLQAQAAIQEFKQEHPDVFEMFEQLVEAYNTKLQAAEKICRAAEVNCGPFDLYQYNTKYNAKALFDAVGRDKFLELGGTVGSEATYDIDKSRFEAAVAAKKVGKDVISQVRKETPVYHKPEALVIP
jgi:hypothetical protein